MTSTVASYVVKDHDFENSENSTEPNESSLKKKTVNAYFEGCQNVKIGDEINHEIYWINQWNQNIYYQTDNKEFFLSRKWFFGFLCAFIGIFCIVEIERIIQLKRKEAAKFGPNFRAVFADTRSKGNKSGPS